MPTTTFETESCSRCGGFGYYSLNGKHSRCYKCDGNNNGQAYTKRGKAAKDFYTASRMVNVADVKIGDKIKTLNFKQLTVVKIEKRSHPMLKNGSVWYVFTNEAGKYNFVSATCAISRIPTEKKNATLMAAALAFQDTLTKSGTPRKRG